MGDPLADLAGQYSERYSDVDSKGELQKLYDNYIRQREESILDSAGATVAINALFLSDQIDTRAITPQMLQAFELQFPNRKIDDLNGLTPEAAKGWLSAWKGKYFEVVVRDKLNAGEQVGDLQLGPGQVAQLADSPTQPGWDLQILDADGTVAIDLQLKATDSLSLVKKALERYPDVDVLATEETAARMGDAVSSSGISDADLEATVSTPMEELLDSPLEQFGETVLPGLPFVLIATTEGAKVLMGRQTLQRAVNQSLERATKTGAAIGVGALAALAGAGVVSLPATFLTRMGIDRARIHRGVLRRLRSDIASIELLLPEQSA